MSSSEAFVVSPSVVESALQKRKMKVAVVHSPLFIGASPRLPPAAAAAAPLLFAAGSPSNNLDNINDQSSSINKKRLTHADIEWKLRPDNNNSNSNSDDNGGTSPKQLFKRLKIKSSATLLRIHSKLSGKKLPPVLCPRGGRAMLEAYYCDNDHHATTKNVLRRLFKRRYKKKIIAKFGFTTSRGPSNNEIDTTIRTIYNINPSPNVATIAAIIYMYVEPQYRQRNVGSLALEVISAIQSVQAVDFTILVASGDDTLVEWYEKRGYTRAPLLQNMMGSPNGEYGVAMIAPVHVKHGFFDECCVKWWR
jgi:GNAT superfamily N-acetyltransferase